MGLAKKHGGIGTGSSAVFGFFGSSISSMAVKCFFGGLKLSLSSYEMEVATTKGVVRRIGREGIEKCDEN